MSMPISPFVGRGDMNRFLIVVLAAALAARLSAQGVIALTPTKDNTLFDSSTGALSAGAEPGVFCGVTNFALKRRAVLAFDVAGNLPAGATVVSATLVLEVNMASGGPLSIELHRVSADWGESTSSSAGGGGGTGAASKQGDVTWIHRFYPTIFWANAGGDFSPVVSAATSVSQSAVYTWSSAQMADDVQDWFNNPANNFGWMLKSPEQVSGSARRIASREAIAPSSPPRLEVTYLAPPSASVMDFGFGCNGLHLAPSGLPRVGSAGFALDVTGGVPGASAYVIAADSIAPSPVGLGAGCAFNLDVASALGYIASGVFLGPMTIDITGHAVLPAPIPPSFALHGFSIYVQSVSVGTTVTSSDVLRLVLGS